MNAPEQITAEQSQRIDEWVAEQLSKPWPLSTGQLDLINPCVRFPGGRTANESQEKRRPSGQRKRRHRDPPPPASRSRARFYRPSRRIAQVFARGGFTGDDDYVSDYQLDAEWAAAVEQIPLTRQEFLHAEVARITERAIRGAVAQHGPLPAIDTPEWWEASDELRIPGLLIHVR